jgi:hypothetical protein
MNGKTVAPGTYTMVIELKPNGRTSVASNWQVQKHHDPKNTAR